jgi:hypothetical protein
VYVIVGDEIKEPGRKGEKVYIIDGDTIKKPDVIKRTLFGKTVVKPKKENSVGVYEKHSKGVDYGNKSAVGISWVEPKDEIKKTRLSHLQWNCISHNPKNRKWVCFYARYTRV